MVLAATQPAYAKQKAKSPSPASPASPSAAQVKELEKQAAESRARAAALAEKTAKMEKELAAKRQTLTSAASQVKAASHHEQVRLQPPIWMIELRRPAEGPCACATGPTTPATTREGARTRTGTGE